MENGADMMTYIKAFLPMILILLFLYVFMLRPQKKKEKATKDMRNNLVPGDEIVTIGGIVGRVLSVKEDTIVIYAGNDKTKMEFKKWAISEVTKKSEKPVKEAPKAEEPAEEPEKKKIRKLSKKADAPAEEKAPEAASAEEKAE